MRMRNLPRSPGLTLVLNVMALSRVEIFLSLFPWLLCLSFSITFPINFSLTCLRVSNSKASGMGRWGFIYLHCFFFHGRFSIGLVSMAWRLSRDLEQPCMWGTRHMQDLKFGTWEAALSSRRVRLLYTSSIKSHPFLTRALSWYGLFCSCYDGFSLFPPFSSAYVRANILVSLRVPLVQKAPPSAIRVSSFNPDQNNNNLKYDIKRAINKCFDIITPVFVKLPPIRFQ